jgi:acetyl esterase/lipase
VAVLIHGGCWKDIPGAGREQLRHLGPELTRQGIAVWSIGYRRADEPGGGYPGTFHDVAKAIDRIRSEAGRFHLDLSRTVLVGHSAGGHLALWAAARRHLAVTSELYSSAPFVPGRVISLAGVGDLKAFARYVPTICGPGIIERLTTRMPGSSEVFDEVSPAALPPPDAQIVMVSGVLDRLVPPYVAYDYARALQSKGATPAQLLNIPDAGHFDLVTPGVPAWSEVGGRLSAALGVR